MSNIKKRGLGKGLSALFSEFEEEYDASLPINSPELVHEATQEIPLSLIDVNPNQPRKRFDEVALSELANSIRIHGVITPIVVTKKGDRYMIIAGERRYRASRIAGQTKIRATVNEYTEQQIEELSLIENLQREDLNPIDTARSIRKLMENYSWTQEQVADRIAKSRPAIANLLRLLTLTPEVIDMVASGVLSAGHARCLVVVEDKLLQIELAKKGMNDKISVRDFEKLVKATMRPADTLQNPSYVQSLELKDLLTRMQRIFSTKVRAIGNDNKGRIYIDYYNRDDLDRINDLLAKLTD